MCLGAHTSESGSQVIVNTKPEIEKWIKRIDFKCERFYNASVYRSLRILPSRISPSILEWHETYVMGGNSILCAARIQPIFISRNRLFHHKFIQFRFSSRGSSDWDYWHEGWFAVLINDKETRDGEKISFRYRRCLLMQLWVWVEHVMC